MEESQIQKTTPSTSVRALRDQFRQGEATTRRLRLFELSALALTEELSPRVLLQQLLSEAMRFVQSDAGLILLHDGPSLTVQAAEGTVLPVGARILVGGALGTVLQTPPSLKLREHLESRLKVGAVLDVALELLVPLTLSGRVVGVLALIYDQAKPLPDEGDLNSLMALGGFIAASLALQVAGSQPIALKGRSTPKKEAAALLSRLTAREQQVLALLPRGLSNAELGEALGMATGTAKIHVERILHKLGVRDRIQAAVKAAEWGLKP